MDCKHELAINWKRTFLECIKCWEKFGPAEVVILTKARYDLGQDVIEAAKEVPNLIKAYISLIEAGINNGFVNKEKGGKEIMRLAIYKSLLANALAAYDERGSGG